MIPIMAGGELAGADYVSYTMHTLERIKYRLEMLEWCELLIFQRIIEPIHEIWYLELVSSLEHTVRNCELSPHVFVVLLRN